MIIQIGGAMEKNCYIVLMRRWGDIEGHTYIHGIYTDKDTTIKQGQLERKNSDIKYEYQVMVWQMNSEIGRQEATSMLEPYERLMAKQARFHKKYG
jgi:hypothetical protein